MELIQSKKPISPRSLSSFPTLEEMWEYSKKYIEINRNEELNKFWNNIQENSTKPVYEHLFIKEFLWCVHVAGMSASVISQKYNQLLIAHNIEKDGNYIKIEESNILTDLSPVLVIFNNPVKGRFIQSTRKLILDLGWDGFTKKYIGDRSPELLIQLPGIGPALSCHLARNIGNINIIKPDVHLNRLAVCYGFGSAFDMCKKLSNIDIPPGKVDLILWLACVDNGSK